MKKILLFIIFVFNLNSFSNVKKEVKKENFYEIKKVLITQYQGVISPIAVEYIKNSINKANNENFNLLVIELDTPGGLDASMREIVKDIFSSKIPISVYIYPKGARAASAGVFITMASNIAVMSPGTNIGAAHPVMLGGIDSPLKKEKKTISPMEDKILNDASAYIKSISQEKDRNIKWAVEAVKRSSSLSANEALKEKVIDFIAQDLNDLLNKINGFNVKGYGILKVENPDIVYFPKSKRQEFLENIVDPNIAMILMSIGAVGIFVEMYNPGLILPGIIGAISLFLGFYSLQTLSANFTGVGLILLGFIFFIIEIKVMSYGLLSLGAIISIILGAVLLFNNSGMTGIGVSMNILITNLIGILFVVAFLAYIVFKAGLKKVVTGIESLPGKKGIVEVDLTPKGKVLVEGEIWDAESISGDLKKDTEIIVEKVEGFHIKVKKN